jgi:hypothetical protein
MTHGSSPGDADGPACFAAEVEVEPEPVALIGFREAACPDCQRALLLAEDDRGKTVICPGCKRFLGCLWPEDRARPWRRWERRRP